MKNSFLGLDNLLVRASLAGGGIKPIPFSDDFERSDGDLANGWIYTPNVWTIGSGKAIANVTPSGSELVANNEFSAWTGDDPNDWTITNETVNNYITEDPNGAHVVGADGIVTATQQLTLAANAWIRGEFLIDVMPHVSMRGGINNSLGGVDSYLYFAGQKGLFSTFINIANPSIWFRNGVNTGEFVLAKTSVKEINPKDMFALRQTGSSEITMQMTYSFDTIYTEPVGSMGYRLGFVLSVDDPSNPQNFVVAYKDNIAIRVQKCLSGVWSTLQQIDPVAGSSFKVIKHADTYTFYWGNVGSETRIGEPQKVFDAAILNNTYHGMMSIIESSFINDISISLPSVADLDVIRFTGIGDSIMANGTSFYDLVTADYQTAKSKDVYKLDHSAGGARIMGEMDTQTAHASLDDADIIIIELGTNDVDGGDMVALQAEVEENLAELKAGNPDATIFYMNVLPKWTDATGTVEIDKSHIRAAVASACLAQGVTCWDTYTTPWIDAADTSDGTHPNATGNGKIRDEIMLLLP